ncbi:hypothetical protein [Paramaledivibacter caminithermalis]|jgi:hypothetical protein|uniref:Uncharacterized protein n=1 Tax=Paramaledivibacter caminithermalis (strain DSM 15212 / CIP 107654 / DViRD3) TaxID=1121301 RepID=A0A1M6KHQ9_PARC5|nr:hypothetical protein [Paramaledivibacter caminithermalis]SHJ58457.1 hypothetical protein SAMN02745912_00404 [Paramaledivibacter caminithermalis DSM 15212]
MNQWDKKVEFYYDEKKSFQDTLIELIIIKGKRDDSGVQATTGVNQGDGFY